MSNEFDLSMIYFIRNTTKNFLNWHGERSFNGIPINVAILADSDSLDEYIDKILMKMNEDA